MSIWVDIKFTNLVSAKLDRFKVKTYNPYLANCRCPICGDSQKNKLKARGFFFQKQDNLIYKCHNCGAGRNIGSFLRDIDPVLYKEYIAESYFDKDKPKEELAVIKTPSYMKAGSPLLKIKKISQLSFDHPAKQYVIDRGIPNEYHAKLFYCSKFAAWTNTMIPRKLKTDGDTPRLIIPFIDKTGKMFGYQGRSFDKAAKVRYITIMLEDRPKIFGMDTVDLTKTHYIIEGPIDSMFIPNAIAMAGADLDRSIINEHSVFVYDNEPRNPEIIRRMKKVIDAGHQIVIWPLDLKYKDVNDMILGNINRKAVIDMIVDHTYSGLTALVKLNGWKKI